jgi:hypothetical protein
MMTRTIDDGVEVGGIVFQNEVEAEEHSNQYLTTGEYSAVWLEYVTPCGFREAGQ